MKYSFTYQLCLTYLHLFFNHIDESFSQITSNVSVHKYTTTSTNLSINTKLDEIWLLWKTKFNKNYSSKKERDSKSRRSSKLRNGLTDDYVVTKWEEYYRRQIWNANIDLIQLHNLRYDLDLVAYTLGLNQFSDLTWREFCSIYLPSKLVRKNTDKLVNISQTVKFVKHNMSINVPVSFDWRTKGIVTEVKDQKSCGCGWAFATVGALEGQMNRQSIPIQSLSAQQLIDCSEEYGNDGCLAGLMSYSYDYISDNGIQSEQSYPFVGEELPCQYNENSSIMWSRSYTKIPEGQELILKYSLYELGPFAGAISYTPEFVHYKTERPSRVESESYCSSFKSRIYILAKVVSYC
ncbi:unnamed protein product [Heterobilharzia americana]|nr:unnamed protein product [Heterobilharzia americana]